MELLVPVVLPCYTLPNDFGGRSNSQSFLVRTSFFPITPPFRRFQTSLIPRHRHIPLCTAAADAACRSFLRANFSCDAGKTFSRSALTKAF